MNRITSISTFEAARDLKHTQDNAIELMNRIQLLQEQQERNNRMIQINQKQIEWLDQNKKRNIQYQQEKNKRNNDNTQNQIKLQEENRMLRQLRNQRMTNIRQDIYQTKKMQYEFTRNKSQHIQKKLSSLKRSYYAKNKQKRDVGCFEREKARQTIKTKTLQRSQNIRNTTQTDITKMLNKKYKYDSDIKNLQRIQCSLVEKCKISNDLNAQLKQQIKSRIGKQKVVNRKVKKLPVIIKNKPKYSAEDFFRNDDYQQQSKLQQ